MTPHGSILRNLAAAALLGAFAPIAGCTQTPAPRVALSPDSAEVLELALLRVRPAYVTQREALRAGLYAVRQAPSEPRRTVEPAPDGDGWVVQIAAYDTRPEADRAARTVAGRLDERWTVRVERGPGVYRVALGTWDSAARAETALREIRRRYPDAWIRRSGERAP